MSSCLLFKSMSIIAVLSFCIYIQKRLFAYFLNIYAFFMHFFRFLDFLQSMNFHAEKTRQKQKFKPPHTLFHAKFLNLFIKLFQGRQNLPSDSLHLAIRRNQIRNHNAFYSGGDSGSHSVRAVFNRDTFARGQIKRRSGF